MQWLVRSVCGGMRARGLPRRLLRRLWLAVGRRRGRRARGFDVFVIAVVVTDLRKVFAFLAFLAFSWESGTWDGWLFRFWDAVVGFVWACPSSRSVGILVLGWFGTGTIVLGWLVCL